MTPTIIPISSHYVTPGLATSDVLARLAEAAQHSGVVEGLTHGFYHYPARFSPVFVRAALDAFSAPGDWVCDPFLGGGTTGVEALASGRRCVGVDINSLAWFLATARTTPLTSAERSDAQYWAQAVADHAPFAAIGDGEGRAVRNLPRPMESFLAVGLDLARPLAPRARAFARCVLLRVGQWALEGREGRPLSRRTLALAVPGRADSMLHGLDTFTAAAATAGMADPTARGVRRFMHRSAVGLEAEPALADLRGRVRLVVTSPPYPGVHVLYHRWQFRGRRETNAPYWIAAQMDGQGESYYTMGGRSARGVLRYYAELEAVFRGLQPLLSPDATIVQLVAFTRIAEHLPRYLEAMVAAGYEESKDAPTEDGRIWRVVPHRRWYHRVNATPSSEAAVEVVLIHRPRPT